MTGLRFAPLIIGLLIGGWLVFDGCHALMTGDYITPRHGPRAGQLGPWSRLVSALGFEPRSRFIKYWHVALGLAWLGALPVFFLRPASGWWMLFFTSCCTLWYLPIGTILSLAELGLLLLPALRSLR